jgi:hypothetical protein
MQPPPPQPPRSYNGGVQLSDLTEIGRERGPDLQLKIDHTLLQFQQAQSNTGIITANSSITEVLNVISYLVSTGGGTRNFGSLVDTTNSVPATVAGVTNTTGYYDQNANDVTTATQNVAAGASAGTHDPFLNNLQQAQAATTPYISLDDFSLIQASTEAFIPVNILRRTGDTDATGLKYVIQPPNPQTAPDFRKLTAAGANAVPLLSDCVKQMIIILKKTRDIFGPKGWTDLFQKVKGGGGSSKKAKRSRRRHRHKYSSKQY